MRAGPVIVMMIAAAPMLGACASSEGANVALADFNKYGNNYAPFPTDRIQVGMSQAQASALFEGKMTRVSAEAGAETYTVDRWISVAGPDYIGERLFLRFAGGKLTHWKVQKSATIVSQSW